MRSSSTNGSRFASIRHDQTRMRVETPMRFLGYHGGQLGTQGFARDLYEPR
jgi:hypothetical protein